MNYTVTMATKFNDIQEEIFNCFWSRTIIEMFSTIPAVCVRACAHVHE